MSSMWFELTFSVVPPLAFRALVLDITTLLVFIGPPLIAKINFKVDPFSTPHSSNDKGSGSSRPMYKAIYH